MHIIYILNNIYFVIFFFSIILTFTPWPRCTVLVLFIFETLSLDLPHSLLYTYNFHIITWLLYAVPYFYRHNNLELNLPYILDKKLHVCMILVWKEWFVLKEDITYICMFRGLEFTYAVCCTQALVISPAQRTLVIFFCCKKLCREVSLNPSYCDMERNV